ALGQFTAHEAALAAVGHGSHGFHGCAATGGSSGIKAGTAHGDDLDGVARLHGGNGVAGVDGALEGVGAHHLGDVGDLGHVQLGSHARGGVLAAGGGGEQDVAVVAGHGQHLGGQVLGQTILECSAIGV